MRPRPSKCRWAQAAGRKLGPQMPTSAKLSTSTSKSCFALAILNSKGHSIREYLKLLKEPYLHSLYIPLFVEIILSTNFT